MRVRLLTAVLVTTLALLTLGQGVALAHGSAATPPDGQIGPGAEEATWDGKFFPAGTQVTGNCPSAEDDPNDNVCDHYTLDVDVEAKYWGTHDGGITISIDWPNGNDDFDLFVYDEDGEEVARAASSAKPEIVEIDEATHTYEVRVKPFLVAASAYSGVATFESVETGPVESGPGDGEAVPQEAMSDIPCVDGMAGIFPCSGIDLASFLPLSDMQGGEASDIWGWVDPETEREYAIMGKTNGTAFIDVTDPLAPRYLGQIPNPSPTKQIWHDIKVFKDHAFIVSESTLHPFQVFDLTQLRDVTEPQTFTADATTVLDPLGLGIDVSLEGDAHNIAINEDTGHAFSVGTNVCDGGAIIIDVNDPTAPRLLGCDLTDGYTHDAQCVTYDGPDDEHDGEEICVDANEDSLTVVRVDGGSTTLLSRTPYDGASYSHQGWLTEDHANFLLGDELDEIDNGIKTTTYIWDMADLDAPELIAPYVHETDAIDHNLYIRDGLVYQSNYRAGLRILDLVDVAEGQLNEQAFFDTFPIDDKAQFNGTWSNYPYFPSGNVVVSGIEEGLFVLTPTFADDEPGARPTRTPAPDPSASPTPAPDPSGSPSSSPSPEPSETSEPDPEPDDDPASGDRVTRTSGPDRIATALRLSQEAYADGAAGGVVLTRADDYPDALAGTPLAVDFDAPLLLTPTDSLAPEVEAEIQRVLADGGVVTLLGGVEALDESVEARVKELGYRTVRYGGADRFETAVEIAERGLISPSTVLLASGADFPDAVAAGAAGAQTDGAVLLTAAEQMPAATRAYLDAHADLDRYAVGGNAAQADPSATPLVGATRFETALAVGEAFFPAPKAVGLATGRVFADALTGGAAVAREGGPLLLSEPDGLPASVRAFLEERADTIERALLFGGLNALDSGVEDAVREAITEG